VLLVTMLISIMFFIAVILLIERSYKVYALKKIVAAREAELLSYKKNKEVFAIAMSKVQHTAQNLLIDPLTHLLSKAAFDNQYTHLLNQSKRLNSLFAVLLLDINQFAQINEKYSREIGDALLIEVGERLKKTIRDVDILSRHEGDVFILLLPNMIKPEVIVHAVDRIVHVINEPFAVNGVALELTVSIGIAIYPFDGEDKQTLINHAEDALKRSKSAGKNIFQFYQEETQVLGERELNLKAAIKNTDFLRDMVLEFKPYYNTLTNEIDCIEILALLNHPELGKISFNELARISQYSSKMFELYEWMMKNAVEQCMKAHKASLKNSHLIFKFDLKQFEAPHFAEKIIEIINKSTENKDQIIIELMHTENSGNFETYRESICKFNEARIPLAICILVLGHFAINKINNVHFTYLKIDEKLVQDLVKREESRVILERILFLVDNLKLKTLTTGVHLEEQKRILESMNCSLMQGKVFKELLLD